MKIIKGNSRYQMQFTSLDDVIAADYSVRIIDTFVEKLDLKQLGIREPDQSIKATVGGAPRYDNKVMPVKQVIDSKPTAPMDVKHVV